MHQRPPTLESGRRQTPRRRPRPPPRLVLTRRTQAGSLSRCLQTPSKASWPRPLLRGLPGRAVLLEGLTLPFLPATGQPARGGLPPRPSLWLRGSLRSEAANPPAGSRPRTLSAARCGRFPPDPAGGASERRGTFQAPRRPACPTQSRPTPRKAPRTLRLLLPPPRRLPCPGGKRTAGRTGGTLGGSRQKRRARCFRGWWALSFAFFCRPPPARLP
mmetsp:Transcript_18795/g.38678  ORF Transcript_18795/g.38678 Transcript_18795/m.38678 type:complete len:216 (-) Transcript_18795:159-806(-)